MPEGDGARTEDRPSGPLAAMDRLLGLASPTAALRRALRLSQQGKAADAFPLFSRAA